MSSYRSQIAVSGYLRAHTEKWGTRIPGAAGSEGAPATFVTISRQSGAGAFSFSDELARILIEQPDRPDPQWTVFDRDLIRAVAEMHGLPGPIQEFLEQQHRLLESVGVVEVALGLHPSVESLVAKSSSTIYQLATMGRAIIVGRGSSIVCGKLPGGIHLRLIASPETRIARLAERHGVEQKKAKAMMVKEDRVRREYVKLHFDRDIADPSLYHLVINLDRLPAAQAVALVARMVLEREAALSGC